MADLLVQGGRPLSGEVVVSGNKNAALPMLCATLLSDAPVVLHNVPEITDVRKLVAYMQALGSEIDWQPERGVMRLCHQGVGRLSEAPPLPEGMRSSLMLLPALLHRGARVVLDSDTQGCSLGMREIDPHLEVLSALGARVDAGPPVGLSLPARFAATEVWQDYMSVTTTENFVMAAALAQGTSVIRNAASEPHVQDLCCLLNALGARIEGVGSSMLTVHGVDELSEGEASVSPDHHEITTFLAIGAITGGEVSVSPVPHEHFPLIDRAFSKLGIEVEHAESHARVAAGQTLRIREPMTPSLLPRIEAAPWPYFPVDLLPLMVALSVRARGAMQFWNKVYEGGFTWIPELGKFGAHVVVSDPHRIIVFGDRPLHAAAVEAPYVIRAAVALYMVAASIDGQSVIHNADPIRRAHPRFVENLQNLGAAVRWSDA
ncbi:MAG: UDP-N-acetylglucosamine 1-carboxyvinyltransferase [Myxococcales bacterium]|nr:UDP-N-acetylglucosamine 1-carboxyvinyltransferase [Myxococcales bacterium]